MSTFRLKDAARFGIALSLHTLIAVMCPALLEYSYVRYVPASSIQGKLFAAQILTAIVSAGLGFTVYRRWKSRAAFWVWAVGSLWFGQRALLVSSGGQGTMWGFTDASVFVDVQSLINWGTYTVPFIRALFYSIGSISAAKFSRASAPMILSE